MKPQTRRGFVGRYFNDAGAGFNLSWASVIAGLVTFIAMFMLLSLIGSAIGFGMTEPTEANPLEGVGTGVMIWTVITLILSLFCAGMVAGMTARRAGYMHGFLTWAVSLIVLTYFITSAIAGAFGLFGSMVSTVAKGTGKVAGTIGEVAVNGISAGVEAAADGIGEINTKDLDMNIEKYLRDTEKEELQPEALKNTLNEAKDEVVNTGKAILRNPANAEAEINKLFEKLKKKAEEIGKDIDKDAIKNAVTKNTDLDRADVNNAARQIESGLIKAREEAKEQIENLQKNIEEAKVKIEDAIEEARVQADKAAKTASTVSVLLFIGLLLGLLLTSFAGHLGSKMVKRYYQIEE